MRRLFLFLAVLGLLALAAAGGGLYWFERSMDVRHAGWDGEAAIVELEPGLPAQVMLRRLGEAGVLRAPRRVEWWLRLHGGAADLHAGEYRFAEPMSPAEVLSRLQAGEVLLHAVTVPEGLVLDEIAERVAETGLAPLDELRVVFRDPSPIRDLFPEAEDLEGYLFPDTYHFPKSIDAVGIRDAMVQRFREVSVPGIREGARRVGLSLPEAVVLASLIEEETSVPGERPRIARVFHNRLARGMKLQCDPTVRYAWLRRGEPVERLTYDHLALESPWNTYTSRGLPPTPIASPGEASLQAAVAPADGPELYFVARPGGGHTFSNTLAEHNRAVAVWRRHRRTSTAPG